MPHTVPSPQCPYCSAFTQCPHRAVTAECAHGFLRRMRSWIPAPYACVLPQVKTSKPACVNPLTWAADGAPANRSLAMGSLPLLGHLFLPKMPSSLVGARCGDDGILYVSPIPPSAGWSYEPYAARGSERVD